MSCVLWEFKELLQFGEKNLRETKGYPAAGSVGLATNRQGAGDITGRERFEDNASV